MATAPTLLEPLIPVALPESFRADLTAGLDEANANLRVLAQVARSARGASLEVERALLGAWASLSTIERVAGLVGVVNKASATRRVLVVDDSPDMRFLVARVVRLVAPQAAVQTAVDAVQAYCLLEAMQDDGEGLLVVSDHDLGPGPTGADLLAATALRHPRSHRVLFTGHPPEAFEGLGVEAHAILRKDAPDALRRYFGAP